MLKWVGRITDWLLALVLIGAGALGAFHEVPEYGGLHVPNASDLTLGIAGLLAFALGLERFTRFAGISRHITALEAKFDALKRSVHERLNVAVSEGYEKVYDDGIEMLRSANSSIRTLVFANGPIAPARFSNAVIEHLQEHKMVTYDVIIALDLPNAPETFWETIKKRDVLYKSAGVASRIHISILNTTKPIGFDVLVVDERHCAMSLSPAPHVLETNKEFAIAFEEQPKVAARMRAWLDSLHPGVLRLEEAKTEWAKSHKIRSRAS